MIALQSFLLGAVVVLSLWMASTICDQRVTIDGLQQQAQVQQAAADALFVKAVPPMKGK